MNLLLFQQGETCEQTIRDELLFDFKHGNTAVAAVMLDEAAQGVTLPKDLAEKVVAERTAVLAAELTAMRVEGTIARDIREGGWIVPWSPSHMVAASTVLISTEELQKARSILLDLQRLQADSAKRGRPQTAELDMLLKNMKTEIEQIETTFHQAGQDVPPWPTISQPPPHGEAQQSTGSRAQQHEPAVSMESAKYLGCATRLQAAKLRLILCFMHNDRLTENCEVELVGGRVPESIAAFLKMQVRWPH